MRTSENKKIRTAAIISPQDTNKLKISTDAVCFLADDLCHTCSLSPAEIEESVFATLRQLLEDNTELLINIIFQAKIDTIGTEHLERLKAITRGVFRAAVYGNISIMCDGTQNGYKYEAFGDFINKIFCELESDKREFNGYIKKGIIIGTPADILADDFRGVDFLCINLDKMLPHLLCNGYMNDTSQKVYFHGKFGSLCTTLSEYFSEIKLPIRIMTSDLSSNNFIFTLAKSLDAEEIIIRN